MRYVIDKWLGIYTRAGRDKRPVGAFDNIQNLILNSKTLKPVLRTGYATDLTAVPTEVSGQFTLASYRYPRGVHPATESPSAQNVVVLAGTDGSSGKHYFQRPYWGKNDATIDSTTWMKWGEYDPCGATTPFPNAANKIEMTGLAITSATPDYYNGWILCNFTRSEFLYVTDSHSASNVLTFNEDVPSDWTDSDQYVLYRGFHDNPYDPTLNNTGFNPSWTDPIVLKYGNNIIASGGQGSTVGYKQIWSGLINQTWFSGASRTPSMNQTYVCEAECKNTGTWLNPQDTTDAGGGSLTYGKRYWIGLVWETHDGQRSLMYHPSTAYLDAGAGGTSKLSSVLYIQFPKMDKRARYVHVFMAETDTSVSTAASIDWTQWFFVETHDLTGTGFTYTNSTTIPGYYSKTIDLDLPDWNLASTNLVTFLGHTKPNRATVSYSYGIVTNGRLFVAKYYDYNAALSYNDQINFSIFASNGVNQYTKLMDLDDTSQSTIEAGDPSNIKGLGVRDGRLAILKDSGSFWIDVTLQPSQWILNDISRKVGCDAPDSVANTPFGLIWAKSGDGVYLWAQGDPIEISRNWRVSTVDFGGSAITTGFRSLVTTYASSWIGWYDATNRSYRLMYTADGSDKKTVYEAFLDVQDERLNGLPIWVKHSFAHNIGHVLVRSDNVVYFSTDSTETFYFSSATNDGGAGNTIKPQFDTGLISVGEKDLILITSFWLKFYPALNTITGLDILIEVDNTQHTGFTTLLNSATSKDRIASDLPIVGRLGTTFRFKFNSNATAVSLGTAFTALELGFEYEPVERGGDLEQSL